MSKIIAFLKKEIMLSLSLLVAIISLFITPPSRELLNTIDWKTLATLFMLLSVLEGFKKESIFNPVLKLTSNIKSQLVLTCFLVYSVFLTSMFVTNDVSLIIFVPITIVLFKAGHKEAYIIPVLTFENIAAIRGSLLTPFGSPQNLFLFSKSDISFSSFLLMMLPLWLFSAFLLFLFILFLYRHDKKEMIEISHDKNEYVWQSEGRFKRILYISLFIIIVFTIVSRTKYWPFVTLFIALALIIFDFKILLRTDYVLLLTFLCFFVFSSSLCRNPLIADFLQKKVSGHEYVWSILLSQVISNVPASIVLWPFTKSLKALIYGLDSAGLCSIIGSLASVINLRLYNREYPGQGFTFIRKFTWISLIFFAIVVLPQYLLLLLD